MRTPRDVTGLELVRVLERLGYVIVRQEGSHVRLTHSGPPEHHLTIPMHQPLKVGLLSALLKDSAKQLSITVEALIERL